MKDANRHGVPLYITPKAKPYSTQGGARPSRIPEPTHCVWPGCRKGFMPDQDIPICTNHAFIVFARYREWGTSQPVNRATRPTPEPREPAEPAQGWVYYVRIGNYYKIGYASSVYERMKAYPPNAELLAQHKGTKADERAIHKRFAAHLDAGREWFTVHPEITEYIDAVIGVHGRCVNPFAERRKKTEQEKQPVQMRRRSMRR